jgi:heme exporter protein D
VFKFQFESVADFMSMSGHGPYVWACYAIAAACLTYLLVAPMLRRQSLMADLRRQAKIADRDVKHGDVHQQGARS